MSSTRRAAQGEEMASEKFASSGAFERGLSGSLVARRCIILDDPKDKELIWFLHFISHWGIGLKALATALLANYPKHFGTLSMVTFGKRNGNYSADQVKSIRIELPLKWESKFPLRGETKSESNKWAREALTALRLTELRETDSEETYRAKIEEEKHEAAKFPDCYPVDAFISICCRAAADDLEDSIRRLCLDPDADPQNFAPWYFAGLVDALRDYFTQWISERSEGLVVTAIGEEIVETLEYTAYSRKLALIEGEARIGKSFAAKSWCELHPGQVRFVEVPTGNDETSFFRALARGLGIGNFAQYKAIEIRERVESVLLTGDIVLVLDEAHRLWPQTDPRYGFPKRINWVMSMANQGVAICCISTPQFLKSLRVTEIKAGWNSAQLQGRLGQYKILPNELKLEDLMEVASAQLPEVDNKTLRAIADYARSSARYLAAIETISTRARYLASRAGREAAETDDVRRAMQESVIPSDSNLVRALESKPTSGKRKPKQAAMSEIDNAPSESLQLARNRAADADVFTAGARQQQIGSIDS